MIMIKLECPRNVARLIMRIITGIKENELLLEIFGFVKKLAGLRGVHPLQAVLF